MRDLLARSRYWLALAWHSATARRRVVPASEIRKFLEELRAELEHDDALRAHEPPMEVHVGTFGALVGQEWD